MGRGVGLATVCVGARWSVAFSPVAAPCMLRGVICLTLCVGTAKMDPGAPFASRSVILRSSFASSLLTINPQPGLC